MDTISIMCWATAYAVFMGLTYMIVRGVKIKRYTNQLGIGCHVSQIVPQLNPFDKRPTVYEVVDKKWNDLGECWVKLHIPNEYTVFDKTMSVKELYDKGFQIVFLLKK